MTNPEGRTVELEELSVSGDANAFNDENPIVSEDTPITEDDIRELAAYTFDSTDQTLVGIGPVERAELASRARLAAAATATPKPPSVHVATEAPESVRMPQSEPPGPFVASDEEPPPPRLPMKKSGAWAVAVAGVLLAGGALAMVRGIVPRTTHATPSPPTDSAEATAGLAVSIDGARPHVLVDGLDRGAAPLRLQGLEAGTHVISIVDPAFAPYSESVTLVPNEVTHATPRLTFVRGALRLSAGEGAEGATVEIIGESERRELERLPATLEVAPGEYRIRGTREGYAPFETTAVLSASRPAVDVVVALATGAAAGPAALRSRAELTPATGKRASAALATQGTLDISSNPPTNVVLDGRPIGKAPRLVPISPGPHTVVFIHPQRGRMSLNVNVKAGETTTAAVGF